MPGGVRAPTWSAGVPSTTDAALSIALGTAGLEKKEEVGIQMSKEANITVNVGQNVLVEQMSYTISESTIIYEGPFLQATTASAPCRSCGQRPSIIVDGKSSPEPLQKSQAISSKNRKNQNTERHVFGAELLVTTAARRGAAQRAPPT